MSTELKISTASGEISFVPFDYQPRTRLVFGDGSVDRIGELAREIGMTQVLVVTDAGVVGAGHVERALRSLEKARVKAEIFDKVRENPTTRDVEACLAVAKQFPIDGFIGLGGGSSLDTAKGCNFLLTNGGRMQDYWGLGKATKPMLPLVAVPTTAGTGSECQSFALIADEQTHQKMACGDPKAAARVAVLDPALTLSQPPRVAACTGIDALSHALETAVTNKRNVISQAYSHEAFRLCWTNFPKILAAPTDLEARAGMMLGAAIAGLAIENSMLGAAHAAANPLTAHYNIPHGAAVGVMLPAVIRFNALNAEALKLYNQLDFNGSVEQMAGEFESLLVKAELPRKLADWKVPESALGSLAVDAAKQWTSKFNPRPVSEADFIELYRAALG